MFICPEKKTFVTQCSIPTPMLGKHQGIFFYNMAFISKSMSKPPLYINLSIQCIMRLVKVMPENTFHYKFISRDVCLLYVVCPFPLFHSVRPHSPLPLAF